MPRFDGAGPVSEGAMTGRGRGYCIVEYNRVQSSLRRNLSGRSGVGNGYGLRRGGRVRGNMWMNEFSRRTTEERDAQ
jgi:hypothetical protein